MDPTFLLMIVAFGALMYFLMIRPQQKRMKEHQATIGALTPGTRVLLTSGIFATIRHLGERQAIVELAPGTEITIVKGNIARPATEDEEEFEFADEVDSDSLVEESPLSDASVQDMDAVVEEDVTFDPRGERDMTAEELQRKFDN
ncbi:preprotein translocase subunit YajC [Tessaracoccus antarcticus]|uniref:Preprotein translocase subunit YajC n=1 Tax=Tessaracoccus antarcticus TaxID=2479848 RepID=A0A3M0GCC9_9ACTN|nr:preprotein translocase subunit YajC [Tessaracoccus antarcticus]RMB58759.1 preprotein translocase subunit YajC [Tessaracoccus antarcticus]